MISVLIESVSDTNKIEPFIKINDRMKIKLSKHLKHSLPCLLIDCQGFSRLSGPF